MDGHVGAGGLPGQGVDALNPLLIPSVIECVLEHLPVKEVERMRLISRDWDREACAVLQKRSLVAFTNISAFPVYSASMGGGSFHHTSFEICVPEITGAVDDGLRGFWNSFGTHIKRLELRQDPLYWCDLLAVIKSSLPNLEQLALRHLPIQLPEDDDFPPLRMEEHQFRSVRRLRIASLPADPQSAVDRLESVLKAFPNLEILEFLPTTEAGLISRMSNALFQVLRLPDIRLPHLRQLVNVILELDSCGLEALAAKRFPLQRLQLDLADGVQLSSLKLLVNSLQETLEKLEVSFPDGFTLEALQFQASLKTLKLFNWKGSLCFVQHMPSLERLELEAAGCIIGSLTPDHRLKSLKLQASGSPVNTSLMMGWIGRAFPFLNRLQLREMDDQGLGLIYRDLPLLSDLGLVDARCTDQGLTGIPIEICDDLLETRTFLVVQGVQFRRDLFIGSLPYLRKLVICSPRISDVSLALGFVDCKRLCELTLGSPLISDTGICVVVDKLRRQLDLLSIGGCTGMTEGAKIYTKEILDTRLILSHDDEAERTERLADPYRAVVPPRDAFPAPEVRFFEEYPTRRAEERVGLRPAGGVRDLPAMIHAAFRSDAEFMRSLHRIGSARFQQLVDGINPGVAELCRLPGIYIAGIHRLGLTVDDIHSWLLTL